MKGIYKILSVVLVLSLTLSSSIQVSARTATKRCAERNIKCYNGFGSELDSRIVQDINLNKRGNAAVLYFVPGLGEVMITVTGVVIVAGVIVATGSWAYQQAIKYYNEHTKNKRKSTHDKHTKPRPGRDTEKKKSKDKGWKSRK